MTTEDKKEQYDQNVNDMFKNSARVLVDNIKNRDESELLFIANNSNGKNWNFNKDFKTIILNHVIN